MQVDRGGYLIFVSSIALGGVLGYVGSERDVFPHMSKPPGQTPNPAPIASEPPKAVIVDAGPPVAAVTVDAGPVCDDSMGEPMPCPPMGLPTVEGGCGGYATTRCNDFKLTMKPRVAVNAVACLNKLTGTERCDPKRVDLCGHLALMSACEDHAPAINTSCEALTNACKNVPATSIAPSMAECRLTMSGLREVGRDAMIDCAKKHCADKSVLLCEAQNPTKPP